MKHELNENFKMKLQNNEIINFENIISAINAEENIEMLKEYYEILTTKINPYLYKNLDAIINVLQSRIKNLESKSNEFNDLIEKMQLTYVEFEEVLPLLYKYTNKGLITEEENLKIYAYLSNTITIYEHEFDGSINYREKEVFHYTMNYIETKEKNEIETHLLDKYNSSCEKEIESNGKSNSFSKKLTNPDVPLLLTDNETGITTTIIVITTTLILGIFLAVFLLVKW